MAAIKYIRRTVSLNGGSVSDPSPESFFNGEQNAHTFIILAVRDGEPFLFSGSVSAAFLNDHDATVALTGSIVNGAAVVTLSNPCYALSGWFTLTIDVNGATVYECRSRIQRRSSATAYDPEDEVSVAELSAEIAEMRTATAAANTATTAATNAATAAGRVDIDMTTGTNEGTVTITRPDGTTKTQTVRAIVDENLLVGITDEEAGYKVVDSWDQFTEAKYYDINGGEHDGGQFWRTTKLLPCYGFRAMKYHIARYHNSNSKSASIAFFDTDGVFISGIYASELAAGDTTYYGQCAIPDNARYFCALEKTNHQGSYTPDVTLYRYSVQAQLTDDELKASTSIYNQDGTTSTYTGWRRSKNVPVNGFKSLTFLAGGYHSGNTRLESVTFLSASGARITGIYADISSNNPRNRRGTSPIPEGAAFVTLTYNTSISTEKPSIIFHNPDADPINILCLGDSLTEGCIGGTTYTEDNYVNNMQAQLGIGYTSFNAGVGGSQASTWWSTWKQFIKLADVDVVIIMLGLNGGMSASSFETDVDQFDDYNNYLNTITGNTCKLIEWIWGQQPDALIVMASPTYASMTTANGVAAENQANAIPELIKRYHLPVIDVRNTMGINEKNYATWLADDKVHGTTAFYHKLGMAMANGIRSMVNVDM